MHSIIADILIETVKNLDMAPKWMFTGLTYLISKKTGKTAEDHRPITYMSNLYKILTKQLTVNSGDNVK